MKPELKTRSIKRDMPDGAARLLRLLAVNLAAGVALAVLLLGGLMVLNPAGLRDLIIADRNGTAALALLLFGFLVTFGSAAMGSAIMALSDTPADRDFGNPARVLAKPCIGDRPR